MEFVKISIPEADKSRLIAEGESIIVGRSAREGSQLVLDDPANLISRKHLKIELKKGEIHITDLNSKNGVKLNGKKIPPAKPQLCKPEDEVQIGGFKIFFGPNAQDTTKPSKKNRENKADTNPSKKEFLRLLHEKKNISIGRAKENDIVLNDQTVSRKHAEIYFDGNQYWVRDLNSKNGTYVNDVRVKKPTPFPTDSTIFICLHAFNYSEGYQDLRKEVAIRAERVEKKFPNGNIGVRKMNLRIPKAEFVTVIGPSGSGKSTLLKILNGDNPASSGRVFIHGLDLLVHYNVLKKQIGYVPQDDIVHKNLTVKQTMRYAARLRLSGIKPKKINSKINDILDSLFDPERRKQILNQKVKSLSGGERKRLCIAVELLTEPAILFLDEPTSPLDPESIHDFLARLQQLKEKGTTVVMVTHKPEDLRYADKVIMMGNEGRHAYYGKPDEIYEYFRRTSIVEIYSLLSDKSKAEFYYKELYNKRSTPPALGSKTPPKSHKKEPLARQLFWLTSRYFRIKLNDEANMGLLLAQPVIIAGLISLIFKDFQLSVLFLMAISAIWFGVSNAAKEIVSEQSIYKRERMFNLNIHTYIFSKWIVLSAIALVQILIFVSIISLRFQSNPTEDFPEVYLRSFPQSLAFLFFLASASSLFGLLLSSAFSNTEKVMTVVPIALIPQIMLAGVITKIDSVIIELLSYFTLGRWGTEGMARLQDNAMNTQEGTTESVISTSPVISPKDMPGCNCPVNEIDFSETQLVSRSALELLDFYNENLINQGKFSRAIFDHLPANLLAIAGLCLLTYVAIYQFMKKKDSIRMD